MIKNKKLLTFTILVTLLACSIAYRSSAASDKQAVKKVASASKSLEVPSPCSVNHSGKLLLVSISQQHLWACDNQTLVNQSAVTTGKTQVVNNVDDATPTGSWQVTSKATDLHLRGSDANGSWDDAVKYWIPFDGDIGFHDSPWQTFAYGSSRYKTEGSHGCIHLPIDMMAWVFDWSSIGTVVTVQS